LVLREVGVSLFCTFLYSERWEYHLFDTQRGGSITLFVFREVEVSLYWYSERWEYHFICTQRGETITLLVLREVGVCDTPASLSTNKVIFPPL
jgi:hypothetical protein